MARSFRPGLAVHDPDNQQAQQFDLMGAPKPGQAGAVGGFVLDAAGLSSLDRPSQQFSLTGEAMPAQTGLAGGFVRDAADPSSLDQAADGATFPTSDPPTADDTQILIALKDGALFLFDAALLSGNPLELRDTLSEAGLVFGDPERDSDVLEEYGLTNLLGGWLSELHALVPGDAGDLAAHNGFF